MKTADKCILCSSSKIKYLYKIPFTGWRLDKCKNCSIMFYNPIPDIDYKQKPSLYVRKNFERQINRVISNLSKYKDLKKSTICEIGSSYGHLLSRLSEKAKKVYGVELSVHTADYSIKKFKLSIDKNPLGSKKSKLKNKKFNIIIINEVIEHFPDPVKELIILKKHLKKNGIIYIETPNSTSINFKIYGKFAHLFAPNDHRFFYDKKSLNLLLKKLNFKILKSLTISQNTIISFKELLRTLKELLYCLSRIVLKRSTLIKIKNSLNKKYLKKNNINISNLKIKEKNYINRKLDNYLNKRFMGETLIVIAKK